MTGNERGLSHHHTPGNGLNATLQNVSHPDIALSIDQKNNCIN